AQALDWKAAVSGLRTRLADATKERGREVREKTADAVGGVLDRWFQSDRGVASLEDEAGALFASSLREAGPVVAGALKACVADTSAGARLPFEVKQTLTDLDVSLDAISRGALDEVDPLAGVRVERPAIALDDVPVRRSLWDVVTFRGSSRIRRDVFGPEDARKEAVPAAAKQKRLGARGREALRRSLLAHLDAFLPRAVGSMVDRAF